VLLSLLILCFAPLRACAAQNTQDVLLNGSEEWQNYLEQAPVTLDEFSASPLEALKKLFSFDFADTFREEMQSYADVFLFLLLVLLVSFLTDANTNGDILDLIAAGGCSILVWSRMCRIAQELTEKMESGRTFLLGFLPVYAGVLTMGGETTAAAMSCGFLLDLLCLLAQVIAAWCEPLLQCYLALSAACCISTEQGLGEACRAMGRLLRQGLAWAGKAFAFLLGIQRVFSGTADRAVLRTGQLLSSAVPIVGQALSSATSTVLVGVQMLKNGLGFAALAILVVEFVPFYAYLWIHILLLSGCGLFCSVTGIKRCGQLFECLREAEQAMAAAVALFFGISVLGTALMLLVGGGAS
jgi:stage III sporulation protein AE